MKDLYQTVVDTTLGRLVLKKAGLPIPVELARHTSPIPSNVGITLIGSSSNINLTNILQPIIDNTTSGRVQVVHHPFDNTNLEDPGVRFQSLVFDASDFKSTEDLAKLYDFFHPLSKRMDENSRIIVIGVQPEKTNTLQASMAMRALEGFTRSLAKEIKKGWALAE